MAIARNLKGVYIGSNFSLKGQTALLNTLPSAPGKFYAQFDHTGTPFDYGWHAFEKSEFQLLKNEEFEE